MAKPTPGPWNVEEDYGRLWISTGKGKKKIQIADVSDIEIGVGSGEVDTDIATTTANARLIAAAPDLLLACQLLLNALAVGEQSFGETAGLARAAIARATIKE